jgi:ribosomal protein S18 acetylase RimI-like enzyme
MVFLASASSAFCDDPATESVFASWAHVLAEDPSADHQVYLASCAGGAALQRAAGPVLIGRSAPAAAGALADDLARDRPQAPGVIGDREACLAFVRRWHQRTGFPHRWRMRLRQHCLTTVAAVPAPSGRMRVATEADVPWIIGAQLAFLIEAGMGDRPSDVAAAVPRRVERREFLVWDDGDVVAYAGFTDAAPVTARIAPVYTAPAARRRGYATALVAELARELLARGNHALFLTTDAANPTANAIYARIGFAAVSEQEHYDFCGADDAAPE